MNKKRIGALLIGATLLVGALGSFAYFTSNANLKGNGENGQLQAIKITNGKVVVTADITGEGTGLSDWTYDVARLSSNIQEGDVDKHRTPDIELKNGDTDRTEIGGYKRANIGASLADVITKARPGDAIVLGVQNSNSETGLNIEVDSNLTIKMRLIAEDLDGEKEGVQNQYLDNMKAAGWKLYINNEEKQFENLMNGIHLNAENQLLQIRFELPTATGNVHQEKGSSTGDLEGFDLSKLIEIQATQENNTEWEQMDQKNYPEINQSTSQE